MVIGVVRNWSTEGSTNCPDGWVIADSYCFYDNYGMIAIKDFGGWASNTPAFSVNHGEEDNPITVRNYPGEHPVFDLTDSRFFIPWNSEAHVSPIAISISQKHHWVIDGFEMIGGGIYMWGGSVALGNTHDIVIQNNDIHDLTVDGGDNPGIIKIDRGDTMGAYNIFIWNNTLHGIYDWEFPNQWEGVDDMQHFGAVTTLSVASYQGYDAGWTGYIEIIDNTIYNVPQAFFFKNAALGPIEIRDNFIYDSGSLGKTQTANVHLIHNIVNNVKTGFWKVGSLSDDPRMLALYGNYAIIENNTFIGLNHLLGIGGGTYHTVKNNIFFGMNGRTSSAGWNTPAYILKNQYVPLDSPDPQYSILQNITSDHNCFVTPYADFLMVQRRPEGAPLDFYDYAGARDTFGYDVNSVIVIESSPSNIFTNPDNNDFHLIDPLICPNMGYYAEEAPIICASSYDNGNCVSCLDCNGCIETGELLNAISAWKVGNLDMASLFDNLALWKAPCP